MTWHLLGLKCIPKSFPIAQAFMGAAAKSGNPFCW